MEKNSKKSKVFEMGKQTEELQLQEMDSENDDKKKACTHRTYRSQIEMTNWRTSKLDINQLLVKIHFYCNDCGKPFIFKGQSGLSSESPTTSDDATELRVPVLYPMVEPQEDEFASLEDGDEEDESGPTIH